MDLPSNNESFKMNAIEAFRFANDYNYPLTVIQADCICKLAIINAKRMSYPKSRAFFVENIYAITRSNKLAPNVTVTKLLNALR